MIVYNGKIFFIDFLDSFVNSYFVDLSTLFQDLVSLWSYRQEILDNNIYIKLEVIKFHLFHLFKFTKNDLLEIYSLLLLKFLRMIPYTKNKYLDIINTGLSLTFKEVLKLHE
jgi:hypothetical protein